MEAKNVTAGIMGVIIVIALVGTIMAPAIYDLGHEVAPTYDSWIRMTLANDEDYSFTIEKDTNITIGAQSGTVGDMILYADDNSSIVCMDGTLSLIYDDSGTATLATLGNTVNVVKTSSGVTVTSGADNYALAAPNWAYYPDADGEYSYYDHGDLSRDGEPLATFGYYADVVAYNDLVIPDYSLELDADVTTTSITDANWAIPSAQLLSLSPIQPSLVKEESTEDILIKAATTYTDGDWTFTISNTNATLTGYSGAGGAVTIPSTVSYNDTSYSVVALSGTFANNATVTSVEIPSSVTSIGLYTFSNCTALTTLTIPNTVTSFAPNSCNGCTALTSVTLPDSMTAIGTGIFYGCTSLTTITIPEGVTSIGLSAFENCSSLTTITIPKNVTSIGNNCFTGSGITEVLNLSSVEVTSTSFGLNAEEVRADVPACGFIAKNITVIENNYAPITAAIIPIIFGAILVTIAAEIRIRRD